MSKKIIFLSGLSGSGNSSVLRELLDLDYLTISSLDSNNYYKAIKDLIQNSTNNKIAIYLDIDEKKLYNQKLKDLKKIKEEYSDYNFCQIFLTAQESEIINRYQENRKVHPYIKNTGLPIAIQKAIEIEKDITIHFRDSSDYILDTTSLVVPKMQMIFRSYIQENNKFIINFISFGFKYGVYHNSDFLFDTRSLPNPFYVKELRNKTGLTKEVQQYVFSTKEANELYDNIKNIINIIVPGYKNIYKNSLDIAIACTGGKHRSVSFVQRLAKDFNQDYEVNIIHVENDRGNWHD